MSEFLKVSVIALIVAATAVAQEPGYATRPAEDKKGMAPGLKATELTPPKRNFELIFSKGDEVVAGLAEFAEKNHLTVANFTAIGAFDHAILGWFDPDKKAYKTFPINEEMEIASFTGNIRPDRNGKPVVHVHCVVATGDGVAHAGHLLEGKISLTMQLYMTDATPLAAAK